MLKFVLTILLFIPILVESKGAWSYENRKTWVRESRYCAGHLQSPIDIHYNVSHHDRRLKQIVLEERHPHESAELINSGHTAQLNLKDRYVLKNVAPESEDYNVEQIHFHWGHQHDNVNGSEHLLEGQSFPLEVHVVTYSSWYSNIREAMSNVRGLAVVGIFFEISDQPNALLQPLVDALAHVRGQGAKASVSDDFNLKALIGEGRLRRYYRYDGSLTTPPCFESVIWTVAPEPIKISFPQLHAFRYLHDEHAKLIENTYRKTKPLGSRLLFRSFLSEDINDEVQIQQRTGIIENNGQYLSFNMKLIVVLTSLLMIVF